MTTQRRKVCFVLPSLAGGGAERAAVQILNALDGGSWDRSMYLFKREGPYLSELSPGVALTAGSSGSRFGRWYELRQYIAATKPDVVVSFLSYFTVLSAVRASLTRARVVFHQQTPMTAFLDDADYQWRGSWRRRVFALVTRMGYASADLVITSSRGVADDLTMAFAVDPARVRVVGNPVDLDAVTAMSAEALSSDDQARWVRLEFRRLEFGVVELGYQYAVNDRRPAQLECQVSVCLHFQRTRFDISAAIRGKSSRRTGLPSWTRNVGFPRESCPHQSAIAISITSVSEGGVFSRITMQVFA